MDEKFIIKKYFKPLANSKDSLQLRDDVACINVADEKYIVSNQDSLVMGTHFFENDDPIYIAKKSLRVNLSDLISKGVTPYGYFLSLAMDDTIDENWIKLFAQGLAEDQKKYNITLLGGDTVSAPHGLFITINMLSRTNDSIIKRSGACYGDDIYVTGTIGNSAIGLHLLKNKNDNLGLDQLDIQKLIRKYHLPGPRHKVIHLIKKFASSSMDTTDGLINDLLVLAGSSGRKFIIKKNLIPYSISAKKFLNNYGDFDIALYGGDDYEVIFTSPMKFEDKLNEYAKKIKLKITKIGKVGSVSKNPKLFDENHTEFNTSYYTFKHFK
jgi:thiamine-monophosphate kinase